MTVTKRSQREHDSAAQMGFVVGRRCPRRSRAAPVGLFQFVAELGLSVSMPGQERPQKLSQWTSGVKRALLVIVVFFIFQQITGINVPLYYGPHLLAPLFQTGGASALDAAIAGVKATLIIAAVNAATTYFATSIVWVGARSPWEATRGWPSSWWCPQPACCS